MITKTIKDFRVNRAREKDRLSTQTKTKERLGLAQRRVAETSFEMNSAAARTKEAAETPYNPADSIREWMDEYDSFRSERADEDTNTSDAFSETMRPRPRYETEFQGTAAPTGDLMEDTAFITAIENLSAKRGISTDELYSVIKGESAFDPRARNRSGASGLFQFMPDTAKELGTSTEAVLEMSPAEQVALYDDYLERWNYSSENRLGIMQAAPAYANREPDAVIYDTGSAAWKQNPGWRELNDGPITVRSINSYYARQS